MALYNYSKYTVGNSYVEGPWLYDGDGYASLTANAKSYIFDSKTGQFSPHPSAGTWGSNETVFVGSMAYTTYNGGIWRNTVVEVPAGYTSGANLLVNMHHKNAPQGSTEAQGSYVGNVVAENGTYPTNGKHTDGYWYVRGGAYTPPPPSNNAPTITVSTTDNRTLYENDTFTVGGTATDINSGNVVNVKYQINSGTVRAISTAISSGSAIPFNKVLTFKNKSLYDGSTAVTDTLAESTQHVLKVWAEDDQGGKSAEVIRIFYVIPNRPAALTINPFTLADKLINTDKITVSGSVSDPDANTVTVKYKIANGSFIEVYSGSGGNFSFQVLLSALTVGPNTITVQAVDSYGSVTSKTLSVNKSENKQPLLTSVVQYKLTPPNATAKGVVLWIQREVGDLVLNAEISMGAAGSTENFVPMIKSATAFVATGIEEDEFIFDNGTAVENIVLKLTLTRANVNSTQGIKLISGVLS